MKREIDPLKTPRAKNYIAFEHATQPMVTMTATLDITPLIRLKRKGYKLNMLMCYCIGKTAQTMPEFYRMVEGRRMYQYDSLAINVIVMNCKKELSFCDIAVSDDLDTFNREYLQFTTEAHDQCQDRELPDRMVIGTSTITNFELDSIVNGYFGQFDNPILAWGRHHRHWFHTYQKISFQYNHILLDGTHAGRFFATMQDTINQL